MGQYYGYTFANTENGLSHYGVKGQRWGFRRFRNEDGSLTAEGRDHYGIGDPREPGQNEQISQNRIAQAHNYRIKRFGSTVANVLEKQPKQFTPQEKAKKDKAVEKLISDQDKTASNEPRKIGKFEKSRQDAYKEQGFSDKEAAEKARADAKRAKIIAAASGVALAAAVGYLAYKRHDENTDKILKLDTTLQSLSADSNKGIDKAFYATYKKGDNNKYMGLFGGEHLQRMGKQDVYKLSAQTGKEMKVAGGKTGLKEMDNLLSENKDLKEKLIESLKSPNHEIAVGELRKQSTADKLAAGKKLDMKDYETINSMLTFHDKNQQDFNDAYFKALKNKGYGAILDVNDKKYSGYAAKAPIIVFDSSSLKNHVNTAVSMDEVNKHYKTEKLKLSARIYGKQLAMPVAMIAGMASMSKLSGVTNTQTITPAQRSAIKDYKKEHPNTEMSDKEILESLKGSKSKK